MSLDAGSQSMIEAVKNPEITNVQNGTILLMNMLPMLKHSIKWSPNTDYVKAFADKYSFGLQTSFHSSLKELANAVNEYPKDCQVGFSLDKVNMSGEYSVRTLSTAFPHLMSIADAYISESLLREINPSITLNISSTSFSHPSLNNKVDTSSVTTIYIHITFMILITDFCMSYLIERKDRILLLMELCGMRDSVVIIGRFICAVIEGLVLDLILTCMIVFYAKITKDSNFFLIFMHIILFYIGIYWFLFACISLVQSETGGGMMVAGNYLVAVGQLILFMMKNAVPKWLLKLCIVLFPNSSSSAFFSTIGLLHTYYGPLSFSNIGKSFDFSARECYLFQIVNIAISIFVTIIVTLCKHRQWGYAPLGWSGLFKIRKWKKMLGIKNRSQSMLQTNVALNIEEIDKTYTTGEKPIHALKGISTQINEGETIALIGPNGCGKSTLINSLTGSIMVDSGSIELYGENIIDDISVMYNSLGYVAQDNIMIDLFTVEENLLFFSKIRGLSDDTIMEDMNYFISQLLLENARNTRAMDLSGGMKRKLCCAIALMQKPSIMILDEPTAGVDIQSRQTIWKTLDGLTHTTTLISCHSLEEAETVASRIFVMKAGEIPFAGSPAELRQKIHCGYMITVSEGTCSNESLLNCIKEIIPEAYIKENSVLMPIDLRVSDAVAAVENRKKELGIEKYTVHVENLEGNLIKYVLEEE
jgi:ABC-type multidrug transport system ATPase subunit